MRKPLPFWFLLSLALAGSAVLASQAVSVGDGVAHGDPPFLLEAGWMPLIAPNLDGWQYEHPEKGTWTTSRAIFWDREGKPNELLALPAPGDRIANGPTGAHSNIFTKQKFGDVELYLEFLIPAKSNSGVYLQGLYEVQIFDSFGVEHPKYVDCGGIYQRWISDKTGGKGEGGTPPMVNASRRPGEWQSFHIWFRSPKFDAAGKKTSNATFIRVLLNGQLVQENTDAPGPTRSGLEIPEAATNPLMLQGDHGPVAYRNSYWRPLQPLPQAK